MGGKWGLLCDRTTKKQDMRTKRARNAHKWIKHKFGKQTRCYLLAKMEQHDEDVHHKYGLQPMRKTTHLFSPEWYHQYTFLLSLFVIKREGSFFFTSCSVALHHSGENKCVVMVVEVEKTGSSADLLEMKPNYYEDIQGILGML